MEGGDQARLSYEYGKILWNVWYVNSSIGFAVYGKKEAKVHCWVNPVHPQHLRW